MLPQQPTRHKISIHAPREGSDLANLGEMEVLNKISIHAPREGSDANAMNQYQAARAFLSTLPARGATIRPTAKNRLQYHFYPRSPRGERRETKRPHGSGWKISIHAPREGSDHVLRYVLCHFFISIHAPREGSDRQGEIIALPTETISIHAPREGSDLHRLGGLSP